MSGLVLIIRASDESSKVGFGPAGKTRDNSADGVFEMVLPSIYCDDCHPTIKRMFQEVQKKYCLYTHITVDDCDFNGAVENPLLEFLAGIAYDKPNPELRLSLPAHILSDLLEKETNESY